MDGWSLVSNTPQYSMWSRPINGSSSGHLLEYKGTCALTYQAAYYCQVIIRYSLAATLQQGRALAKYTATGFEYSENTTLFELFAPSMCWPAQ